MSNPPCTPTSIGVPTAPKETGVDCIIKPNTTAASGGNPIATINGAAIAAGVPKPDAPSIKLPNNHAIKITCTLLSELKDEKPFRIVFIAPEYFNVFKSIIAPKIIHKILTVMMRP